MPIAPYEILTPACLIPYGNLTAHGRNGRAFNRRLFMLDLAFIALGAGTLIALAIYAAALDRL